MFVGHYAAALAAKAAEPKTPLWTLVAGCQLIDIGWSVEVAIPWTGLAAYNDGRSTPPRVGDVWRVNFSRVQWTWDIIDGRYVRLPKETHPEDNWVWSPQGVIDMHRPEHWGRVSFAD